MTYRKRKRTLGGSPYHRQGPPLEGEKTKEAVHMSETYKPDQHGSQLVLASTT